MKKNLSKLPLLLFPILLGITLCVTQAFFNPTTVRASSDSDDDESGGFLLLLAAGPAFYSAMLFKYRNSDKRHFHERETEARIENIKRADALIKSEKGTTDSKLPGNNESRPLGSRLITDNKKSFLSYLIDPIIINR
jgi:hypothetical protein